MRLFPLLLLSLPLLLPSELAKAKEADGKAGTTNGTAMSKHPTCKPSLGKQLRDCEKDDETWCQLKFRREDSKWKYDSDLCVAHNGSAGCSTVDNFNISNAQFVCACQSVVGAAPCNDEAWEEKILDEVNKMYAAYFTTTTEPPTTTPSTVTEEETTTISTTLIPQSTTAVLKSGFSPMFIYGGVGVCVCFVAVGVIGVVVFFLRRRRSRKAVEKPVEFLNDGELAPAPPPVKNDSRKAVEKPVEKPTKLNEPQQAKGKNGKAKNGKAKNGKAKNGKPKNGKPKNGNENIEKPNQSRVLANQINYGGRLKMQGHIRKNEMEHLFDRGGAKSEKTTEVDTLKMNPDLNFVFEVGKGIEEYEDTTGEQTQTEEISEFLKDVELSPAPPHVKNDKNDKKTKP